jgi:hypothetical protein
MHEHDVQVQRRSNIYTSSQPMSWNLLVTIELIPSLPKKRYAQGMFMINYQKLKQLKNVDFDHVTIILSLSLYEFKLLFNK